MAGGEGVDSVRGRNSQEETVGKHTMGDPCNGDKLIPPLIWNPESFLWVCKMLPNWVDEDHSLPQGTNESLEPTWRIIPFSKWLTTIVSKLINGGH